jgi:hypothetical protein
MRRQECGDKPVYGLEPPSQHRDGRNQAIKTDAPLARGRRLIAAFMSKYKPYSLIVESD